MVETKCWNSHTLEGLVKKIGDYPKGNKEVTRVLYQVSFASSIVNAGDVLE